MTLDEIQTLRLRLKKIMLADPETASVVSKEIGIAMQTLMGFINGTRRPDLKRLYKIENWIIKKEQ